MVALICSASCTASQPAPEEEATYHEHVRPILESRCTPCHAAGGIGPYPLDTYASAAAFGPAALAAVEAGRMPPWMPSAECRSYHNERRIQPEEMRALRRWIEGGMTEGDPARYTPPQEMSALNQAPREPDLVLSPREPYLPSAEAPDDYRCFALPHQFTEETFLVMTQVVPERPELVHHALIYLVLPQFVSQLDALDVAEPGEGYTCFGTPGTGSSQNIGAWVPGSVPAFIEGDAAIRIPAGGRLVMQMHYNTMAAQPAADRTQLRLWMRPDRPANLIEVRSLPHLGLQIAAGDPAARDSRLFTNTSESAWTTVSVAGHMHLLGTRVALTAVHADGEEECLLDIPRWDFGWQQSYRFREPPVIEPGESVRLDCEYDNSAAHQPIVNGVQLTPRDVTWGEGTLDEMCLGYLALIVPYYPVVEPDNTCPDFQACYEMCAAGPTFSGCAFQCANRAGGECAQCVVPGVFQCAIDDCPTLSGDAIECIESCRAEPDTMGCARSRCLGQLFAFDECIWPKVIAGGCDIYVSACGADL